MSENNKHQSGKFRDNTPLPLNNPELPTKKDWWDELCKAHGAKNHWRKDKKKKG